jgi:hypothetical protein
MKCYNHSHTIQKFYTFIFLLITHLIILSYFVNGSISSNEQWVGDIVTRVNTDGNCRESDLVIPFCSLKTGDSGNEILIDGPPFSNYQVSLTNIMSNPLIDNDNFYGAFLNDSTQTGIICMRYREEEDARDLFVALQTVEDESAQIECRDLTVEGEESVNATCSNESRVILFRYPGTTRGIVIGISVGAAVLIFCCVFGLVFCILCCCYFCVRKGKSSSEI